MLSRQTNESRVTWNPRIWSAPCEDIAGRESVLNEGKNIRLHTCLADLLHHSLSPEAQQAAEQVFVGARFQVYPLVGLSKADRKVQVAESRFFSSWLMGEPTEDGGEKLSFESSYSSDDEEEEE